MDPLRIPFDLRDLIIFLSCIFAAFGSGIVGVVRGHNAAGALAALGFLMLSLEAPAEMAVFRFWMDAAPNAESDMFNWVYSSVSAAVIGLGVCFLTGAFFMATKSAATENR